MVTIKVGGTVRWTNVGTVSHTVSFGDQSIPSRGTQNPLASDQTFNVTFSSEGTFNYVCIFHPPNMVGKVIVEP